MAGYSANSGQLALGVHLRDDATFDNFFCGDANKALKRALTVQLEADGEQIIYIHGVAGSGRSHLLQSACHQAASKGSSSVYLPMRDIVSMPAAEVLDGIEHLSLVCIDDVDAITANSQWQEALFHFINRARALNCKLLLSADNIPANIGVGLADLRSRLGWGLVFQVHALVESELAAAMQMRAFRRGLTLSDEVINYILSRCTRDLGSLLALLETLDQASMAEQRKLSIPFVRQYLDSDKGE